MKKVLSAGVMLLLASFAWLATAGAQEAAQDAKPKSARKPAATKKTAKTSASKLTSEKKAAPAQSDVKASGRDAASYYEIGMGHYESKRFKDAVEAFQQSIRLGSTDPKTYFNLGQAYFSLNRFREARESYKRAVKAKPDWDEAHYRLGWMYHILGDKESALAQYKILQSLNQEMAANFQKLLGNDGKAEDATTPDSASSAASTTATNTEAANATPAGDKSSAQAAAPEVAASDTNQTTQPAPDAATTTTVGATTAPDATTKPDAAVETRPAATAANTPTSTPADTNSTSAPVTSTTPTSAPSKDEMTTTTTATAPATLTTTATAPESAAAASASEMPPTSIYRVGIGDVLDIRLLNTPTSRSTLFTVMSGGLIEYPLIGGSFTVAGLTPDEIGARLTAELKRRGLSGDSQVVVGVRDYASHSVIVSGLVNYPGRKPLQREAVPLYVLMAEAQLRPDAGRAVIMRAGETIPVNDLTDPAALNVLIKSGDVVTVAARQLQYYFIGGRINSPGQKAFQPGLTLIQAILAAGGLSRPQETAEISREEADGRLTTTKFVLKQIKSGKIPDPRLQPGDRIQVGQ